MSKEIDIEVDAIGAFKSFLEGNQEKLPDLSNEPEIKEWAEFWFIRGYENAAFSVQVENVLAKTMEYVCEAPLGSPERMERFSHGRIILEKMNIMLHPDAVKEVLEEGVLDEQ